MHNESEQFDTPNQGSFDDDARDQSEVQFDIVTSEFTERLRSDTDPPSIKEYIRKFPDLAEQIENLFPLIQQLEQTKQPENKNDHSRWKHPQLQQLGDHCLIREIGRGGMGVVYEARQLSLDRRVALKVLRDELSDSPKNLARFQREARLAAMLHHSNIVPVLGTGSERGVSFIVMQLIDGVGLNRIIEQLSQPENSTAGIEPDQLGDQNLVAGITKIALLKDSQSKSPSVGEQPLSGSKSAIDWKKFAQLALQINFALTHAHQRQVIHRDIKPSNLIIDRNGKPWVVDFGLARTLDMNGDFTRIAGTPRYMAPEQLAGNGTAASDIYGLGVTLYELAGRVRVVDDDEKDHDSSKHNLRNPRSLPMLGTRAKYIPKDLEQIVMKCVEHDEVKRYQSTEAVAEDLERFLNNEPLANSKTSIWDRAKRWTQRNPQTALATGFAVAMLLAVTAVSTFSYFNERAQRERMETTLQVSLETLDRVYNRLSPDNGLQQPLSAVNAKLLNDLLASYDQLAQLNSTNLELRMTVANANFRVGEIHRRLGSRDRALASLGRSIQLHRKLASEHPEVRDQAHLIIVRAIISEGLVRNSNGLPNRAKFQDALVEIEEFQTASGIDEKTRVQLQLERARTLVFLGETPRRRPGDFDDLIEPPTPRNENTQYLERAIGVLEQWTTPWPAEVKTLLARAYAVRSTVFNDEDSRQSIELQESLASEFPDSNQILTNLVDAYSSLDPLLLDFEQFPLAAERLVKTIRISSRLDLNDRRVRGIVKHSHHKLALLFGRVAQNEAKFSSQSMELILGNGARNALDEAVRHGKIAVEVNEAPFSDDLPNPSSSSRRLGSRFSRKAWMMRFRITLCNLLWQRNRGNDRNEVREMIEQAERFVAPINLSTDEGKNVSKILQQLSDITKSR